jgi:hypothetical protein
MGYSRWVSLVLALVFGGLASAIYGPAQQDQAMVPRAEKPRPTVEQQPTEKQPEPNRR